MSILNRRFGCEFEFSTNFDEVAEIVKPIIKKLYGKNKIKIKEENYPSNNNYKWHLKTDFSTECELATPVSTIEDLPKILKVIKYLHKNHLKITKNDALHIHISANDVPKKNIIVAWLFIEKAIMKCFNKNRQNNEFCPKLNCCRSKKTTIDTPYNNALQLTKEHHSVISLHYYQKRKTVEFRASQATFNTDLIEGWILFCLFYLDWAKKINIKEYMKKRLNEIKTPKKLIKELNIKNKKVKKFVAKHH